MYNRYIPQPDGTYRRNRMPEPNPSPPSPRRPDTHPTHQEQHQEPPKQEPQKPAPYPPQRRPCNRAPQRPPARHEPAADTSVSGFLKRLLPKDFDTGDLLIVLILLLMAGDNCEDQNTALLTLALYFVM